MKKLLSLIILSVFVMLFLSACGTINRNISFSNSIDNIDNIEIYYLEEAYTTYSENHVYNLRDENEPLCVLTDTEVITALINDISSLTFTQETVYFPVAVDWVYEYEGYVISVVYLDGGYDIIAQNGQLYFSINSKGEEKFKLGHSDYYGEIEWTDIVKKYVKV